MTYQRVLLATILATACLISGCGGNSDSGPTAEGSGAPGPASGAAGSAAYSGAGAGASSSR